MRVLIRGVLINARTHKKIVKMPVDSRAWINTEHHAAAARASVANVVSKVPRLPDRFPWRFIFGSRRNGGLGIPHPAVCLWVRFVCGMHNAMWSVHRVTNNVTQWEVQPAFHRDRMLAGLPEEWSIKEREGTDYQIGVVGCLIGMGYTVACGTRVRRCVDL